MSTDLQLFFPFTYLMQPILQALTPARVCARHAQALETNPGHRQAAGAAGNPDTI